jgi:hypothetical protein
VTIDGGVITHGGVAIGSDEVATGDGGMVTGSGGEEVITGNRDTNPFKITIDVNSITIPTTCRVIVDMKTTSGHKYPKRTMCQLAAVYELIKWIIQHTLVNPSPYIKLVISRFAALYQWAS